MKAKISKRAQELRNQHRREFQQYLARRKKKKENSRTPEQLGVEKELVYTVLADNGPDVSISFVGRILPSVRKRLAHMYSIPERDAIRTCSKVQIYRALSCLEYFGPKSDALRAPADKYY